jgi:hypothetical protein
MTKRRDFIKAGLMVPVVSLVGLAGNHVLATQGTTAADSKTRRFTPAHFVFDERFTESTMVADFVTPRGVRMHAISDDLTALWYNHLDLAWKRAPVPVAGMTSEGALFYLERLAWKHRMRLIFRARHDIPANGTVRHELSGTPALLARFARSGTTQRQWARTLGHCLTRCEPVVGKYPKSKRVLKSEAKSERDIALVSWILAASNGVA